MKSKESHEQVLTASTGQKCPVSGEWEVIGTVTTTVLLSRNQLMPDYLGQRVVWRLIRKDTSRS